MNIICPNFMNICIILLQGICAQRMLIKSQIKCRVCLACCIHVYHVSSYVQIYHVSSLNARSTWGLVIDKKEYKGGHRLGVI